MVREGERYRREVGGEAVKNFRRTADFLGCCELKAVKTLLNFAVRRSLLTFARADSGKCGNGLQAPVG